MKKLEIAIFVTKFDPTFKNPWLTDELCQAFADQGHKVDVFFLDWHREFSAGTIASRKNINVHIIAPIAGKFGVISKMIHWALSSFNVSKYYRSRFKPNSHDILISFSPSIIFGIPLIRLKSWFKYRVLIQWDFFPYHQAQIGLIPFRWITKIGAIFESICLSSFTYIGCMSQRNIDYLIKNYDIPLSIEKGIIPLWAKIRDKPIVNKIEIRKRFNLPLSTPIAVFGGQIASGRGLEDIVNAAELAKQTSEPVHFLFIGNGPKLPWLNERIKNITDYCTILPYVPRDQYLELISCCDAGIVATIRDVDVPTFPSKTLDYCCVGLPIIASVEESTDFGDIVAAANIGVYCNAGDASILLQLCLDLFSNESNMLALSKNSRTFYSENFDVQKISINLLSIIKYV